MSDGGSGESSKEIKSILNKKRRKNDEFAQAIAKIAVAQVCESVGFQGFQQSALDTFSDVTCKYIREIGKTSHFYANLAGRTECNVFDIIQGLEDLSFSQGFVGASDRDHCLSGSGIIKEISQFVNLSEEISFAYSVLSFPVVKVRKSTPTFLQTGETPPTDEIPPWLPKFPDSNTYISIPSASTEENETIPDKIKQKQKILKPQSSKLEQFWVRNESEFPAIVEQGDYAGRERVNNPFLAVPLQPGEREISVISVPAKYKEEKMIESHTNHVCEMDTFGPENEEVKKSGCDTDEGVKQVVLNNKSRVKLKFEIGKKSIDNAIRQNDKGKREVFSWFLNDEVSDEKGKFVREAMDIEEKSENCKLGKID